jgi:rhodanese-related sulfurtransferase
MTTQQGKTAGGQGQWIGGFAAGVLVVALAGGAWWMMQKKSEPAAPPAPMPQAMQMPATAPAQDAHDDAEIEKLVAQVPRISPDALDEELKAGTAIVIDVRDQQAYIEDHIPGAWQMPLQFVEGELSYMPKDKKIVTYCSCPAEETSGRAVLILQKGGLQNVAALQGGIDLWREMKLPLEKGLPAKK